LNPQQYHQSACLLVLTVETKGLTLCALLKRLFDPVFSDPPLLPVPPSYLLIRHIVWRHSAHAPFGVYC
ncbi:unnamed protein product, partial [Staurois parvus]